MMLNILNKPENIAIYCSDLQLSIFINEPGHSNFYKVAYEPREDSSQPVHRYFDQSSLSA